MGWRANRNPTFILAGKILRLALNEGSSSNLAADCLAAAPNASRWESMEASKRILVVDDEADFCALVQCCLQKAGFEVEVAYDGSEGWQMVRANPPDAIVLDVMMPEMDGNALCKKLKADIHYRHIPVILLTVAGSHITSTRYSQYGKQHMDADDYLPKPASAEAIAQCLKRLLNI